MQANYLHNSNGTGHLMALDYMTENSIAVELRAHDVFKSMPDTSFEHVVAASCDLPLVAGQDLMREGESGRDVFLLLEGEAEAYRTAPDGRAEITLNQIHAGDCLGELAMIDGSPRTSSVRATSQGRAIQICVDTLSDERALSDLKAALAAVAVRRARQLSTAQLQSLQAQLDARVKQTQFGMILLFTIVLMLLSTSLFYLVAENIVEDVYDPAFSWQTVLLFAVPSLAIIAYLRIPPKDLGIRREGLGRSVWQALALTVILGGLAAVYLLFFKEPIPAEERPVQITVGFLAQYLVHSVVQEIGARGLLQGMFQRFLDDKKGHQAVALSSIIFASMHITFGAGAVVLAFFASLLFGYMYLYQKNLAGVVIFHYGLGVIAALMVAL